jgi:hypothetical protein
MEDTSKPVIECFRRGPWYHAVFNYDLDLIPVGFSWAEGNTYEQAVDELSKRIQQYLGVK